MRSDEQAAVIKAAGWMTYLVLAVAALAYLLRSPVRLDPALPPQNWASGVDGFLISGAVRLGRSDAELTLTTAPVKELPPETAAADFIWGWGGGPEHHRDELLQKAHVAQFKLAVRGRPIRIPRRAVADLIDLRADCEVGPVVEASGLIYVYCWGSDAGESYFVRFTLKDGSLTRRDIWQGEFPEFGPTTTKYDG